MVVDTEDTAKTILAAKLAGRTNFLPLNKLVAKVDRDTVQRAKKFVRFSRHSFVDFPATCYLLLAFYRRATTSPARRSIWRST